MTPCSGAIPIAVAHAGQYVGLKGMPATLSHMVSGCDGLQRRFVFFESVVRAADGVSAKGTGRRAPPGRSSLTLADGLRPSLASDLLATALCSHPVHHPHSSSRDGGRAEIAHARPSRRCEGSWAHARPSGGVRGPAHEGSREQAVAQDARRPSASVSEERPGRPRRAVPSGAGPLTPPRRLSTTRTGCRHHGKRRAAPVRPNSAPCWHLAVSAAGTTPPGTASGRLRGACVTPQGTSLGRSRYFFSSSRRRSSRSSCLSCSTSSRRSAPSSVRPSPVRISYTRTRGAGSRFSR